MRIQPEPHYRNNPRNTNELWTFMIARVFMGSVKKGEKMKGIINGDKCTGHNLINVQTGTCSLVQTETWK